MCLSSPLLRVTHSSRDTYVEREPGESNNDRNDRAIRTATHWYNKHLLDSQRDVNSAHRVKVVLLTEDADNRRKAEALGLITSSIREYVESMTEYKMLADKLSQKNMEYAGPRTEFFPQHLAPNEILEGVKSGKLKQGSFAASRENYLEGFVNVEGFELPVRILSTIARSWPAMPTREYNLLLIHFHPSLSPSPSGLPSRTSWSQSRGRWRHRGYRNAARGRVVRAERSDPRGGWA